MRAGQFYTTGRGRGRCSGPFNRIFSIAGIRILVEIVAEHLEALASRIELGLNFDFLGLSPCPAQGGQQDADEERDNADDGEELDQREAPLAFCPAESHVRTPVS